MITAEITVYGAKSKVIFETSTQGVSLSSALRQVSITLRKNRRAQFTKDATAPIIKRPDALATWRNIDITIIKTARKNKKV